MGKGLGKYGIGVRVVDSDGDAGEIVDKRKGERLVRYDRLDCGLQWVTKGALRTEKWVPKVGERVRFKRSGELADVRAVYPSILIEFDEPNTYSHDAYGDYVGLLARGGCAYFVQDYDIEPVVAPATTAPLNIQAGRFYKTRCGRKVGPMTVTTRPDYVDGRGRRAAFWEGTLGHVTTEGLWLEGHGESREDLIAEWAEPAPVQAPATATKFKVGDRVVALKTSMMGGFVAGKTYEVSSSRPGHVSIALNSTGSTTDGWGDHNFELSTLQPGTRVTITGTGRVTARTGTHTHVVIDGAAPGQNSFAIPTHLLAAE